MFKQKNKKIIQCDSRITLDAKHNEIIKNFKEEQKNLKKYYLELKLEEDKLNKTQMDNSIALNPEDLTAIFEIQNYIDELKEKIKNIELQSKETDYFIKTGNILYEYYNEMDDVAKQEDDSIPPKKKEKKDKKKVAVGENEPKIGAFFGIPVKQEEKDIEENNEGKRVLKMNDFVQMGTNIDRASKLDAYLSKIDKSYGIRGKVHNKIDFCKKCKVTYNKDYELIVNHIEGFMSCLKCGHMEYVIIESDKPNYKDPPPEATYFAYKRTNHLNEILNQIQAKESTDIPDEVLDAVREEIRKERIKDLTELTNKKIRYYLRKLNLNKYYEHIAHIINRLNGLPPPIITKDIEDKIRIMFSAVNSAWGEIPKKPKKNFLNYNYVLYKFVELLDRDEYKVLFPLLKSRDKIVSHDVVWKEICEKLGWEFLRTI
jgi:Poxvirus Late Transcription Factor VLTF3 like